METHFSWDRIDCAARRGIKLHGPPHKKHISPLTNLGAISIFPNEEKDRKLETLSATVCLFVVL